MVIEEGDLNLTEYLIMETLIARVRLGESCWTFPRRRGMLRAIKNLEKYGLVDWGSDSEYNYRVVPTHEGKMMFMVPNYPYGES